MTKYLFDSHIVKIDQYHYNVLDNTVWCLFRGIGSSSFTVIHTFNLHYQPDINVFLDNLHYPFYPLKQPIFKLVS